MSALNLGMGQKFKVLFFSFLGLVGIVCNPAQGFSENASTPDALSAKNVLSALVGDDSAAFLGFTPRIKRIENPEPNAFAVKSQSQIVISAGLLDAIKNPSELAFVLAHELGHLVLHSGANRPSVLGQEERQSAMDRELEADMYAVKMLRDSGFDPAAGQSFISRVMGVRSRRNLSLGILYPSLKVRLERLKRQQGPANRAG